MSKLHEKERIISNRTAKVINYAFTDQICLEESKKMSNEDQFSINGHWFSHSDDYGFTPKSVIQIFLEVEFSDKEEVEFGALINTKAYEYTADAKWMNVCDLMHSVLDVKVAKSLELCINDTLDILSDSIDKQNQMCFWLKFLMHGGRHLLQLLLDGDAEYIIVGVMNFKYHSMILLPFERIIVKDMYKDVKLLFKLSSKQKHKNPIYKHYLQQKTKSPTASLSVSNFIPSIVDSKEISTVSSIAESVQSWTPFYMPTVDKCDETSM